MNLALLMLPLLLLSCATTPSGRSQLRLVNEEKMAKAGFKPRAAVELWKNMKKQSFKGYE